MNFGPRTNPCEGGGSVKPSAWVTPQGMQLGFFFLFRYSLLACDLWRSWRGYIQSVSCPLSAQWRLVASTPLPSAQGSEVSEWELREHQEGREERCPTKM